MKKIIFHVPHDGTEIPAIFRRSVVIPWERLMYYQNLMRDRECLELVPVIPAAETVYFPYSRLFCDVERFPSDEEETMAKYGMGFCYERVHDGTRIKHITPELLEQTRKLYDEHHRRLNSVTEGDDDIFLVDLHSFSEQLLREESFFEIKEPLPDICIGSDSRFSRRETVERVMSCFAEAGYSVAENYPYSGVMVPSRIYRGASGVNYDAVMLEVNKAAYIGKREAKARIREIIKEICMERIK